ncbi:hypothetical protein AAG906_006049 [Vitis piasezkii]
MSPIDSKMNQSWIHDWLRWNDWASSGLTWNALLQLHFGAREVALEAPEIFLAAPEMAPANELAKIPEKILERKLVMIPEMEPISSCGFGGAASPEEKLVLAKALERDLGRLLCRLFLRFEGDEDLAPRVRAISGYRTLADVANRRG